MSWKYSMIHDNENRHYRYNYETGMLEWVVFEQYELDDFGNSILTKLDEPKVLRSVELSVVKFESEPKYWIKRFHLYLSNEPYFTEEEKELLL